MAAGLVRLGAVADPLDQVDVGDPVLGGERLGELLGGKGRVLMMPYQVGSASTMKREQGFLDAMAEGFPEIEVVSSNQHAGVTSEEAQNKAENLLSVHRDLAGIFTPWLINKLLIRFVCLVCSLFNARSSRWSCRSSSSFTLGACTTLHTFGSPPNHRIKHLISFPRSSRSVFALFFLRSTCTLAGSITTLSIP